MHNLEKPGIKVNQLRRNESKWVSTFLQFYSKNTEDTGNRTLSKLKLIKHVWFKLIFFSLESKVDVFFLFSWLGHTILQIIFFPLYIYLLISEFEKIRCLYTVLKNNNLESH